MTEGSSLVISINMRDMMSFFGTTIPTIGDFDDELRITITYYNKWDTYSDIFEQIKSNISFFRSKISVRDKLSTSSKLSIPPRELCLQTIKTSDFC